jgi:L-seryl-tRNA(Ser) seleniumtransferase
MPAQSKQELLQRIPSVTELLKSAEAAVWLKAHPLRIVTECLRGAAAAARKDLLKDNADPFDSTCLEKASLLQHAAQLLADATEPRLRHAINATGIILHTGLGRAVFAERVVESIGPELRGYTTLAIDRETGERTERDRLVEPMLLELTGAEAATVVNNNAAATLLVLAGLAAGREVIVSRGQLIEIGGSFRLPEVMAQSGARLVEVGATNRTHLRDYSRAITSETAAIMRVHPSNYRIVGFTSQPSLGELAELAHQRNLLLIDDLGAGALLGLEQFGLPHEPTVPESIRAGADVVLFSGDKLIGASQAGVLAGRKAAIDRLRKHPLMRAMRVDKTCLMVLERTLRLFRDPKSLRREHPTYRMLCIPLDALRTRAETLLAALRSAGASLKLSVESSAAYLGSGSLPTEEIPSVAVKISVPGLSASELAKRLRLDEACIFARVTEDSVWLDMRTITDEQAPIIAQALKRIIAHVVGLERHPITPPRSRPDAGESRRQRTR